MLLQHISNNITTLKRISDDHFQHSNMFMTKTLQLLKKMMDHIDNVLNKIIEYQKP